MVCCVVQFHKDLYYCIHATMYLYDCLIHVDADSDSRSSAHRSDYVFGSRKRRRVPPLPYSSDYDGFSTDTSKAPRLSASVPGESVGYM